MILCCQGPRFTWGLAPGCFVGIIALSEDSAANPDVCGSNLDLQRDRKEQLGAGLPPTPASTAHLPHHRTVPQVVIIMATASTWFEPQDSAWDQGLV